ncbi:MAG: hypothetical protein Q7R91_00410 [bacterium]|nr:hypothetical protein [bacterium]
MVVAVVGKLVSVDVDKTSGVVEEVVSGEDGGEVPNRRSLHVEKGGALFQHKNKAMALCLC